MARFLKPYAPHAYALMRMVVGFLFLFHGIQKLFDFPPSGHGPIPAFIAYVAGPIELGGGALVLVGLFAHEAAFLCSGLMAAAYWMAHGTKALLPIQNQGEPAALYCFVFLFIAAHGSGIWSLDAARGKA
ncbi:MAG: DoxX family protein [Planctomycetes bacterium]|nr:DoxX family protein [Planctomycetota bacterium]